MSVNYYPKGAVIAFLLDAKIRKATSGAKTLDDGMRGRCSATRATRATPRSSSTGDGEVAGTDLKGWFATAAESTEELDYTEALDYYGLRFRPVDPRTARASIGAGTRNEDGRLVVTSVDAARRRSTRG